MGGVVASCQQPVPQADLQAAAHGKELYVTLVCDSCHGLDAVGSTRSYAPTHNQMRATAEQRIQTADYSGQANTAAEYIRESIVNPKAYVVDGYQQLRFGMASYAHLDRLLDGSLYLLDSTSRESRDGRGDEQTSGKQMS
jgi:hypothetical protein